MIGDIWYRVEDAVQSHGYSDEWGDWHHTGHTPYARLRRFWVIRETPKGVWLIWAHKAFSADLWTMPERQRIAAQDGMKAYRDQWWSEKPFFVMHGSLRGRARATIEEAVISFKARKAKQLRILRHQIKMIEGAEYDADIGKFVD